MFLELTHASPQKEFSMQMFGLCKDFALRTNSSMLGSPKRCLPVSISEWGVYHKDLVSVKIQYSKCPAIQRHSKSSILNYPHLSGLDTPDEREFPEAAVFMTLLVGNFVPEVSDPSAYVRTISAKPGFGCLNSPDFPKPAESTHYLEPS